MKFKLILFWLFFMVAATLYGADIDLQWDVYNNDEVIYKVDFVVKKTAQKTGIFTDVIGKGILENNVTYVDADFEVLSVDQTSNNQYNNAFFAWKIKHPNGNNKTDVYYKDLRTGKEYDDYDTVFPKRAYTLQVFLYLIQELDFSSQQNIDFSLIVPPAHLYNMNAQVDGLETVDSILGKVECYKLELAISGLLSLVLPKYTFWITKEKPHIPVKYKDNRFTYILAENIF